jgi:hypothetical protein
VGNVGSAGAGRCCNVNGRWRLVDFLTMEMTVLCPQVLALPPARARAHPDHDPVLTHPSSPCAPAGRVAVLLQCNLRRALVAGAVRELRTCGFRPNAAARAAADGRSAGGARCGLCLCTHRAGATCPGMALWTLCSANACSCVHVCSYLSG